MMIEVYNILVMETIEEAVSYAAATNERSPSLDQISQSVSPVAGGSDRINTEMDWFMV